MDISKITRRLLFRKAAMAVTVAGTTAATVTAADTTVEQPIKRGRLNLVQREAMKQIIAQQAMLESLVMDAQAPADTHTLAIPEAVQVHRKHVLRVINESLMDVPGVTEFVGIMMPRAPRVMAESDVSPARTLADSKEVAISLIPWEHPADKFERMQEEYDRYYEYHGYRHPDDSRDGVHKMSDGKLVMSM